MTDHADDAGGVSVRGRTRIYGNDNAIIFALTVCRYAGRLAQIPIPQRARRLVHVLNEYFNPVTERGHIAREHGQRFFTDVRVFVTRKSEYGKRAGLISFSALVKLRGVLWIICLCDA